MPPSLLTAAVKAPHPRASCNCRGNRYINPLGGNQLAGRSAPIDKAAIALKVGQLWDDEPWPEDLRRQVSRVVRMVREANDIEPT